MRLITLYFILISLIDCVACRIDSTSRMQASNDEHQQNGKYLQQQYRLVGGQCEGCEAIFEYTNPKITSIDTLPDFNDEGPRIRISGTVYKPGGKEPASGVILYVYHTNQKGKYPTKGNETGWARRHGYIRGWVQTDENGQYAFYTLKPGTYPSRSSAAHIHVTILEPSGKYYWLGSYLFEGDPLLTDDQLNNRLPRGGSDGILSLKQQGDLMVGKRDIELGKNVPDYE